MLLLLFFFFFVYRSRIRFHEIPVLVLFRYAGLCVFYVKLLLLRYVYRGGARAVVSSLRWNRNETLRQPIVVFLYRSPTSTLRAPNTYNIICVYIIIIIIIFFFFAFFLSASISCSLSPSLSFRLSVYWSLSLWTILAVQ
jgi:hypothetical protein